MVRYERGSGVGEMSHKVDWDSIKISGNLLPNFKAIQFSQQVEPIIHKRQTPIAPTIGYFECSASLTINRESWNRFLNVFPNYNKHKFRVGYRTYPTLYGAKAASKYWRMPVERV